MGKVPGMPSRAAGLAALLATLLVALVGRPAWAQLEPEPGAEPELLVQPPKVAVIRGALDVNLGSDRFFDPVVIAPDGYVGVTDNVEVSLVHTSRRRTGFFSERDAGFCITGEDSGCIDFYDSPAALVRVQPVHGDLELAFEGGFVVVSLSDPFAASIKFGALGRWRLGALALELDPNIFVGIAGRTVDVMGVETNFNRERLHLPLTATYQVVTPLEAFLQVGIGGELEDFFNSFAGPVAAGARFVINDQLSAFAFFGFDNLIGNDGGVDNRRISAGAEYRFESL